MATLNENYDRLAAGYLFPEIAKRTGEFQAANPDATVMKLGIGNTTEPLKPRIIQGLHEGVEALANVDTYSGYGDEQGNTALREAIAKRYANLGVKIDPTEVFVSDGAKPDSANIQSIFGPDNIIAVQDPAYPVYVDTNVIAGRAGDFDKTTGQYKNLVYMACTEENGFFPAVPEGHVDIIYLCFPNNPTGATGTKEQLKTFVDYANEHGSVIISDAAYVAFIQDESIPKSILEIDGAKSCAIEINSFSKDVGFTGVRLGYTVVSKAIANGKANQLWNRRQCTFFNGPSNIVQAGGLAALTEEGQAQSQENVDFYMENARIIRTALEGMDMDVFGGVNAPYVWMKTPNGMPSWDFFDKLLNETHVVGTPGVGFGPSGEGFFRLSAFGHRENIEQAVKSIEDKLKL